MAPLTLTAFMAYVMPELHALTLEFMEDYRSNKEFTWIPEVFDVEDTNRILHEYGNMQRTRDWPEWTEGEDTPVTEWNLPTQTRVQLSIHQDSFQVTRHYMEYANPFEVLMPKLIDFTQDFVLGGYRAHNRKAGAIMLDVFDGDLITTPDGEAMASNNHTHDGLAGYDNFITDALDETALETAFALNAAVGLVDLYGNPIVHDYDTLYVGAGQKINAWRLINNIVRPDATNDEKNYWPSQIKRVIEIPWWRERFKAGASQWWALVDESNNPFKGLIARAPSLLPETNADVNARHIVGETVMQYFHLSWQGVILSDGTT